MFRIGSDSSQLIDLTCLAQNEFDAEYYIPAVILAHVGLRLFPGFPVLYEPLLARLQAVQRPSDGTVVLCRLFGRSGL
jgi:hypothetical protein